MVAKKKKTKSAGAAKRAKKRPATKKASARASTKSTKKSTKKSTQKTRGSKATKKTARKRTSKRATADRVSVGDGEVDVQSIERLIRLMSENDLVEIEVRNGPEHQVRLSRRADHAPMVYSAPPMAPPPAAPRGAESSAPEAPAAAVDENTVEFLSPMVGTFYLAPSPEQPPYITTGDKVVAETILCIIEAMKVMNEIKAEVKGEVIDILVENGEAVEYGQPLFLIRKAG